MSKRGSFVSSLVYLQVDTQEAKHKEADCNYFEYIINDLSSTYTHAATSPAMFDWQHAPSQFIIAQSSHRRL